MSNKKELSQKEENTLKKIIDDYKLNDLSPEDIEIIRKIAFYVSDNLWYKDSLTRAFTNPEEKARVNYIETLVDQNWLIIKQLNSLNSKLDKLLKK